MNARKQTSESERKRKYRIPNHRAARAYIIGGKRTDNPQVKCAERERAEQNGRLCVCFLACYIINIGSCALNFDLKDFSHKHPVRASTIRGSWPNEKRNNGPQNFILPATRRCRCRRHHQLARQAQGPPTSSTRS